MTLKFDFATWDQTEDELRELAFRAPHPRTRERFLALYEVARGASASAVAHATGRHIQTVIAWVHRYNEHGPSALQYVRTGGVRPFSPAASMHCGP